MPIKAPHPCQTPGCRELITSGAYCPRHARRGREAYDQARGNAAARGYGGAWRRLRARYLAANPLCKDPDSAHPTRTVLATMVDHIRPLREGGTHDWNNLQGLCQSCHNRKTQSERAGRGDQISEGLDHRDRALALDTHPRN